MRKLISASKHSVFFDTKYCWFLLALNQIFKNPLRTGYIDEFHLMRSENVLQPKTEGKMKIMFILTKAKINLKN